MAWRPLCTAGRGIKLTKSGLPRDLCRFLVIGRQTNEEPKVLGAESGRLRPLRHKAPWTTGARIGAREPGRHRRPMRFAAVVNYSQAGSAPDCKLCRSPAVTAARVHPIVNFDDGE